mgnify:CR=1 FL=1
MTKQKNTKRALLASVLSMMLCMAMLVGSTFAWFTDSVTSGKNKIVAGNLDVELEYATEFDDEGNPTKWETVEGATDIFSTDPVWEPGHTEVVVLRIRNAGSLALKYHLDVEKISESYAYNVDGNYFYLSDFLVFNRTDDAQLKSREAYWNADLEDQVLNDGVKTSNPSFSGLSIADMDGATKLEAGQEKIFSAAIYMPTSVGNEANWREKSSKTAPYIELGLNLYATQVPHEEDSFGPNYDTGAKYDWDGKSETAFEDLKIDETEQTVSVNNAEDLVGALKNASKLSGYTVKLDNSVNLNNQKWTSRSISNITLDGQGNTISGLNGTGGLFSYASGTIKNLTLTGVVNGSSNIGALVNRTSGDLTVDNCVIDVDVTGSGSSNVGGIMGTNAYSKSITIRNSVYKGNVTGTYVGGMIGFINTGYPITLENNTNEGTVTSPSGNAGGIAGHIMNAPTPITGTIRGCTNNGTVTAKNFAGGILGYTTVTGWAIVDCTNTGAVTGATAGGILGGTNVTGVVVENCQNSGTVTGNGGGGSV